MPPRSKGQNAEERAFLDSGCDFCRTSDTKPEVIDDIRTKSPYWRSIARNSTWNRQGNRSAYWQSQCPLERRIYAIPPRTDPEDSPGSSTNQVSAIGGSCSRKLAVADGSSEGKTAAAEASRPSNVSMRRRRCALYVANAPRSDKDWPLAAWRCQTRSGHSVKSRTKQVRRVTPQPTLMA